MRRRSVRGEGLIHLSAEHAAQVSELARAYQLSEEEVVARALDLLVAAAAALGAPNGSSRPGAAAKSGAKSGRRGGRTAGAQDPEELAMQRMLAAGLLSEIKPLPDEVAPFTPIEVRGKPLSELIIEERR